MRQADANKLGHDGQEVEQEEIANRECSPKEPETLDDQAGMSHTGHDAQAHDHLLIDDQDRNEQHQHPEQARAVVLPRLRISGYAPRVVIADHHDEAGADDGKQREQARHPGAAGG